LQDQVSALQATIDGMSKEFLSLNDKLLQSNLLYQDSELIRELQRTTERFLALARASENNSSADEGDSGHEYQSHSPPNRLRPSTSKSSPSDPHRLELPLGYVQVFDDDATSNRFPSRTTPEASQESFQESMAAEMLGNNVQHLAYSSTSTGFPFLLNPASSQEHTSGAISPRSSASDSSTEGSLTLMNPASPWTYSIDERTFARRLHRASIERAYHLLAEASSRPVAFQQVFKLSLLSCSREDLISKARYVLTKPTTDPLEFFRTPFIHLGGAGTHYDTGRKDNAFIVKPGPFHNTAKLLRADTGTDAGIQFEMDLSKYEGDWFDPNDVEGYLESLGVVLNPRATFAEIFIQEDSQLADMLRKAKKLSAPSLITDNEMSFSSEHTPYDLTQGMVDDATMRLFPELGLGGDPSTFDSTVDANDASSWLMGGGDRTPEMLTSGWSNPEVPNAWDPIEGYKNNVTPQFNTALSTITRKITMDVSGFLNGKSRLSTVYEPITNPYVSHHWKSHMSRKSSGI
jgi:hypothetical protein